MACESLVTEFHCSRTGTLPAKTKDLASSIYRIPRRSLPNFAENLATDALAARLTAGHDTLRSGHDRNSQATLHAADLILAHVHAATGTRHALQIADRSLVVHAVLQVHAQKVLAVLFNRLEVGN